MELRARFLDALRRGGTGTVSDVSPSRMSGAVAEVLGVAGAGLVMMQELVRWPVGASDDHAHRAEQVQATLNEGPCLSAARQGRVLAVNEAELAVGWPVYHRELRERTPYRATLSFPIGCRPDAVRPTAAFAALDLYCTAPEWTLHEELDAIAVQVVDLVAALLLFTGPRGDHDSGTWPTGWDRQRTQVWTSVGMITEAGGVTSTDAIAILRGYAFAHGQLLDDVADQMMTGRLSTDAVLDADPV